jgi:hypothetical protein
MSRATARITIPARDVARGVNPRHRRGCRRRVERDHRLERCIRTPVGQSESRRIAYAMAGADGLFVAKEIGGDAVDLVALFNLHGRAIYDTARRLAASSA